MCGGGRRRRRRGKRGREEAAMHTIRDGEHILGNIGDFVKFVVAVSERIANNNVLPHRRLEKTLPATANNSDGKKGLIFLTYLFKVPDFNEALEIIVNNVFLLSQENKVTSSSGGSRNRRQRRGRRRKGGAMPILGSVVSAVGILMMWFGNGQRQKDADKFLEDTIEKFRKITGLNMRNLVYYIQQQKKFSQIYPPLREHCAQGGANDFSTTYSPPSTALVPVSNTGSPDLHPLHLFPRLSPRMSLVSHFEKKASVPHPLITIFDQCWHYLDPNHPCTCVCGGQRSGLTQRMV